jgi:Cdc6-like AAA superfamily ATPase
VNNTTYTRLDTQLDALVDAYTRTGQQTDRALIIHEGHAICAAVAGRDGRTAWETWTGRSDFAQMHTTGTAWADTATPLLRAAAGHGDNGAAYAEAVAQLASIACDLPAGLPLSSLQTAACIAATAISTQHQNRPLLHRPPSAHTPTGNAHTGKAPTGTTATGAVTVTQQPADRAATTVAAPADSPAAEQPARTVEEVLDDLNSLIGLGAVKTEIRRQLELLRNSRRRAEHGLTNPDISRHMVFTGNPGTGKTTVARIVGELFHVSGLLPTGQLIECDRAALVAGYLGQTALKTAAVIDSAIGGVLFIDEAYTLASDDFGQEAIDTIVKAMEDHRDDLVVIVAGYPANMDTFITSNPGLRSRFRLTISFDDYTDTELEEIFTQICTRADYTPDEGAVAAVHGALTAAERGSGFGNGRWVRNLFEAAISHQAWRLRDVTDPTVDQLRTLTADDVTPDNSAGNTDLGADLEIADGDGGPA